jgi:hypothetical protein
LLLLVVVVILRSCGNETQTCSHTQADDDGAFVKTAACQKGQLPVSLCYIWDNLSTEAKSELLIFF